MNKCIVLCGGLSERFGENKLLFRIEDKTVAEKTVGTVLASKLFDEVIVVARKEDDKLRTLLLSYGIRFVDGGQTRFESVYNGLNACGDCDIVAIHDGARCFVSETLIKNCVDSAQKFGSGVAAALMTDTVRERDGDFFGKSVSRDLLVKVQTPQAFRFDEISGAYGKAYEKYGADAPFTDDSEVYTSFVGKCRMVISDDKNAKITYKSDVERLPLFGVGYDIHRLKNGDGITLCGEKIPCEKRLIAHSDGDVPVHALMDGILSSLGKKDIGWYFPDTDDRYKGISSLSLLEKVLDVAKEENRRVESVSIAIVCERPKLAPYIDGMRRNIANALGISESKVGIAVTTNEKVGEVGRENAIASYCTVVLQ